MCLNYKLSFILGVCIYRENYIYDFCPHWIEGGLLYRIQNTVLHALQIVPIKTTKAKNRNAS